MPENVNAQVLDTVTAVNAKVGGESPAHVFDLVANEAAAHFSAMNQLRLAATAKATELLLTTDPKEAASVSKVLTGNDLAQQLAALGSAVAAMQQQIKGAQTTPPVTADGE